MYDHSVHWDINPPQKHHLVFLVKSLFRQRPPLYWFFMIPPESRIFQWTSKILQFFIFITIYLLKLTKFLGKISLKKSHPLFSRNSPLKVEVLSSTAPLCSKFGWRLTPQSPEEWGVDALWWPFYEL